MSNEETALKFVTALGKALEGSGSINEVDELVSADDFKWQVLPSILQHPEMDCASFKGFITKTSDDLKFSNVVPDILETVAAGNKVIVHMKNTAKSAIGDYAVEAMYNFTFNDNGEIIYFKEFVDSLATVNFRQQGAQVSG